VSRRAAIFGCEGPALNASETAFFADAQPYGFILFQRNCETPDQVRTLVEEMREAAGAADAPVLIDQEGGRVQRLKPPLWRAAPAAARFGALYRTDPQAAREALDANLRLLAVELKDLGITVDCIPCLDVPAADEHGIIGDRAFAADPALNAELGRWTVEALTASGVVPVVKHLPGHGRARVDSHEALPVVDAAREELDAVDFAPFRALRDAPAGMTAHVVYTALDADRCATLSPTVIEGVIRKDIGFTGLLMSDDLSMKALSGDMRTRAGDAIAAGCDVALHCNGDMDEMKAVASATPMLSGEAAARAGRLEEIGRRPAPAVPDPVRLAERLDSLLSAAA
jgi:beta-N-acetylhexosaminidase